MGLSKGVDGGIIYRDRKMRKEKFLFVCVCVLWRKEGKMGREIFWFVLFVISLRYLLDVRWIWYIG